MKPLQYTCIVGTDWQSPTDGRHTLAQICARRTDGAFESHAITRFRDGKLIGWQSTDALMPRKAAAIRLAMVYLSRSVPQQFA
jgi:hypothetical protein